jgi:hypothetical protein
VGHETIKTVFTYLFALVALVGSMLLLRFPPPGIPPEALLTFVVGITSASLGYVFGERSAASGAANAGNTVIAQPPSRVEVNGGEGPVG